MKFSLQSRDVWSYFSTTRSTHHHEVFFEISKFQDKNMNLSSKVQHRVELFCHYLAVRSTHPLICTTSGKCSHLMRQTNALRNRRLQWIITYSNPFLRIIKTFCPREKIMIVNYLWGQSNLMWLDFCLQQSMTNDFARVLRKSQTSFAAARFHR